MMIPVMNPDLTFDEAFAAGRRCTAAAFQWRGKVYHTRRDDEEPKPPPKIRVLTWVDWNPDPAPSR